MTRQKKINHQIAARLIKEILTDPPKAIEYERIINRYKTLSEDYEKLSFEYDLLLTTYERLQNRHSSLLTGLSG